jgi:hypothetical protein
LAPKCPEGLGIAAALSSPKLIYLYADFLKIRVWVIQRKSRELVCFG